MQGEILSPLLFSLYISDIEDILKSYDVGVRINKNLILRLLMYADDMVALSTSKTGLQMIIRILHKYFTTHSLNVHLAKTKVVVFRRNGGRLPKGLRFVYDGQDIEIVNKYTYLGVIFSSSGVFSLAAKHFKQKGLMALGATWSVFTRSRLESIERKFHLFSSLVASTVLYGAHIWGLRHIKEIEKVEYQFHRRLLGLEHGTPSYGMRLELGREPLRIRIARQALLYLRKLLDLTNERYAKQCLLTLYTLSQEEPHDPLNWMNQIKNWISPYASNYDWSQINTADLLSATPRIIRSMIESNIQDDKDKVTNSEKFNYYQHLSPQPSSQAAYLKTPTPIYAQRIIAQCRLGQGRFSWQLGSLKINYNEE